MRTPRTLLAFVDAIDTELAWRLKELSDLRIALRRSDGSVERTLLRGSVPLLYAHWEGFVKASTETWVAYVNFKGHKYRELRTCFVANGLKRHLDELGSTNKVSRATEIVDFFRASLEETARLRIEGAANTRSNLSSKVFDDIARSVGVDPSPYETKYHLIDTRLVDRRNTIAHGNYLDLTESDYSDLHSEVVGLMRLYKTDLSNLAALDGHLTK